MSSDRPDREPTWIERESIIPLRTTKDGAPSVESVTNLSADTVERRYPELIVWLSERRRGMKLKNVLAIADGTYQRAARVTPGSPGRARKALGYHPQT
jgi:hypothetical protein